MEGYGRSDESMRLEWAERLARVIDGMLSGLENSTYENVKAAEVSKLMELHAKLAGPGGGKKAFWRFIEDIRYGRITCENGDQTPGQTAEANREGGDDAGVDGDPAGPGC